MVNVKRRLFSLNFAILMLLSLIQPAGAINEAQPQQDAEHQYAQYLIVDGVEYDAAEDHSGKGWHFYYDESSTTQQLYLEDYNGSSILANMDLDICIGGTNIVTGTTYGIYTTGTLGFGVETWHGQAGHLTVSGANGYEAIFSDQTLSIGGDLTAIGGNRPALSSKETVDISTFWPSKIWVGNNESDAQEGTYSDQQYISFERIPYTMTLHGNGGLTEDEKNEWQIISTTGMDGFFHFYSYNQIFSNGDKRLIGWSTQPDGLNEIYRVDDIYQYPVGNYSADLYAVWEDDLHKAVLLNNYYGTFSIYGWMQHTGDTLPICVLKGEQYVLPNQERSGCTFDGWLAEDGVTLYPAGTVITVEDTMSFTAQFTALTLKIDGSEYDASEDCSGIGWHYYTSNTASYGKMNPPSLSISQSYSGLPIEVQGDISITLRKSMSSLAETPPIIVHGNAFLDTGYSFEAIDNPIVICGNKNIPALMIDGELTITVLDDNIKLILKSGDDDTAAIQAKTVFNTGRFFTAGPDAAHQRQVATYSGEPYTEFFEMWTYCIDVQGNTVLPTVPEHNLYSFVAWRNAAHSRQDELQEWYMPGDEIDAGNGMKLEAEYIDNNRSSTAIVINGQGGTTQAGSRYYITFASTGRLDLFKLPDNPFSNNGKLFNGYNTTADGSGTAYQPGDGLPVSGDLIRNLYAQWKTNSSSNAGGSSGGSAGGGGGGVASSNNTISTSSISNGKILLDKTTAKKGDTVTITVTPDTGYELGKLTVTDAKGNTIATTKKGDNQYTFTMPNGKVTVAAAFTKTAAENPSITGYTDVADKDWYTDAVAYVTEKGLMSGTGSNKFSPSASTTRGMLMTVLARYAGEDTTGSTPWYQAGMDWAKTNGVSDGTNPTANITREQLVTMLYRYAGSPAASGSLSAFTDSASVNGYAVNAMQWAAANGIVNGSNGRLDPQNNATRAEVAAILMRFCEMSK